MLKANLINHSDLFAFICVSISNKWSNLFEIWITLNDFTSSVSAAELGLKTWKILHHKPRSKETQASFLWFICILCIVLSEMNRRYLQVGHDCSCVSHRLQQDLMCCNKAKAKVEAAHSVTT